MIAERNFGEQEQQKKKTKTKTKTTKTITITNSVDRQKKKKRFMQQERNLVNRKKIKTTKESVILINLPTFCGSFCYVLLTPSKKFHIHNNLLG